ncbi:non-ribosomal peptide synthetase [Alteromonas sp. ASW11-130]|uniref:non-ribosomal peptide synthetase n=1 Tax=Alteromonas sp. ASW11-130 TaxID=3015775 RepID=UPI00224202B5|nr:amino acid adenylation domain-containing protein [Alteromonas sp. ASW11-130]
MEKRKNSSSNSLYRLLGNNMESEILFHSLSHIVPDSVTAADVESALAQLTDELRHALSDEISWCLVQHDLSLATTEGKTKKRIEWELNQGEPLLLSSTIKAILFSLPKGKCLVLKASRMYFSRFAMQSVYAKLLRKPVVSLELTKRKPSELYLDNLKQAPVAEVWHDDSESVDVEPQIRTKSFTLPLQDHREVLLVFGRVLSTFSSTNTISVPVLFDQPLVQDAGISLLPTSLSSESAISINLDELSRFLNQPIELDKELIKDVVDSWGTDSNFPIGLVLNNFIMDSDQNWMASSCLSSAGQLLFPLTVDCQPVSDSQMQLTLSYDATLFSSAQADLLENTMINVAADLLSGCKGNVQDLLMVSQSDTKGVIATGEQGLHARMLHNGRIEEKVSQLARLQPQAAAVKMKDEVITYSELEVQSDKLAHYLIEQRIKPGCHVGLCLSRSSAMITAALAVMKVGAVYVPIDPMYPNDRISFICQDADLGLLVTDSSEGIERVDINTLHLDSWVEAAHSYTGQYKIEQALKADAPAYMIYTSGSTGKPKGTLIPHQNVQYLIGAVEQEFELSNQDVWSMFHSFSFDFSIWEMWGALLTGAQVCVISYDDSRDTKAFIDVINKEEITILSQTPSAFNQLTLVDESTPVGASLRLVVFGGESLNTGSLLPWFDRHPESQCRLVNMFGITETTVHVTAKEITRLEAINRSRSVGKAINGWNIYILDDEQNILPNGIVGEIYVSGKGVATGYYNREKLNEERFIANPFGDGKLYRSGDKGRLLPNGELEHLGRFDSQVKIRGFRIELGEIKHQLLACEYVQQAAVVVRNANEGDDASAQIVCYVLMDGEAYSDIWTSLNQVLPEFMLPSTVYRVSEVPLTANGKLNEKRLPEFVISESSRTEQIKENINIEVCADNDQSTDFQDKLLVVWQEIFNKEVTTQDNFFDLGGNSLYAIQMATKMREFGMPEVNLRDLYKYQTISNIAKLVAA